MIEIGDGKTTGLLTGIDIGVFDRVHAAMGDLQDAASAVQAELEETHLPAIDAAKIEEWSPAAKLAYELLLLGMSSAVSVTADGAGTVAWLYGGLDSTLHAERFTQFPGEWDLGWLPWV